MTGDGVCVGGGGEEGGGDGGGGGRMGKLDQESRQHDANKARAKRRG